MTENPSCSGSSEGVVPQKNAAAEQMQTAIVADGCAGKIPQLKLPIAQPDSNCGVEAQPFLKWAGGKGQLLPQLEPWFPRSIDFYAEPFVGGGAVFFRLKKRFPKMGACLRDSNAELINCYQMVRDNVERLMQRLDEHLRLFRAESER